MVAETVSVTTEVMVFAAAVEVTVGVDVVVRTATLEAELAQAQTAKSSKQAPGGYTYLVAVERLLTVLTVLQDVDAYSVLQSSNEVVVVALARAVQAAASSEIQYIIAAIVTPQRNYDRRPLTDLTKDFDTRRESWLQEQRNFLPT